MRFTIDNDGKGRVLLFKGGGVVSKLIEWQTRSEYSHAAILYPDGEHIIESMQGVGVRTRRVVVGDLTAADVFAVPALTVGQWRGVLDFCERELGSGYDYRSIARFLTRTNGGSSESWFCSEIVFAAIESAGLRLLERTKSWKVSPGHLSLSPYLL